MSKKLGSLESKLKRLGLDIFFNFLTLKTFQSNKPLKIARTFSSLVILMRVKEVNKALCRFIQKSLKSIFPPRTAYTGCAQAEPLFFKQNSKKCTDLSGCAQIKFCALWRIRLRREQPICKLFHLSKLRHDRARQNSIRALLQRNQGILLFYHEAPWNYRQNLF